MKKLHLKINPMLIIDGKKKKVDNKSLQVITKSNGQILFVKNFIKNKNNSIIFHSVV